MEELYFVISYEELAAALPHDREALNNSLSALVKKALVQQMRFDEAKGDFIPCDPPDLHRIEQYHYLATKKGLLAHNG